MLKKKVLQATSTWRQRKKEWLRSPMKQYIVLLYPTIVLVCLYFGYPNLNYTFFQYNVLIFIMNHTPHKYQNVKNIYHFKPKNIRRQVTVLVLRNQTQSFQDVKKFRICEFNIDSVSKKVILMNMQSYLYPVLCTTIHVHGPIGYMYFLLTFFFNCSGRETFHSPTPMICRP